MILQLLLGLIGVLALVMLGIGLHLWWTSPPDEHWRGDAAQTGVDVVDAIRATGPVDPVEPH